MTTTEKILGKKEILKMKSRIFVHYIKILYYLLKKDVRLCYSFIFTKMFVMGGEGSGRGAAFIMEPIIRKFPSLAPYPYNLEIEVTTKCHRKCILCEHTYWNEESKDLSFEDFLKIVEQFPGLKWCNLTGEGTCWLNKDFIKMLEYMKSKGVSVYFAESFDMLDKDIANKLVEIGIDGIYFSMDAATKETYEKLRVGFSYDRTISN